MKSKIIHNVHLCTDMLSDELAEDIYLANVGGERNGWHNQKEIIKINNELEEEKNGNI